MILEKLAEQHNYWLSIARRLVGEEAEDLVQDLYIRIHDKEITLQDIPYGRDFNKNYIYITLRNLCYDHLRKKKKMYFVDIDNVNLIQDDDEYGEALDKLFKKIEDITKGWDLWDRKNFENYMFSGLSFRQIAYGTDKKAKMLTPTKKIPEEAVARGSEISVTTLYHTIKKCKEEIKKEMYEDFEDFKNGEYERI